MNSGNLVNNLGTARIKPFLELTDSGALDDLPGRDATPFDQAIVDAV